MSKDEADEFMHVVGDDQQIWFMNTRSPQDYVEENNAVIQYIVDTYDNAHLIDWYGLSADHPEYFDGDGTHLTMDASRIYGQIIYDAVSPYFPKRS